VGKVEYMYITQLKLPKIM